MRRQCSALLVKEGNFIQGIYEDEMNTNDIHLLILNIQHLPIKSLKDAEYVLEEIHRQETVLQFYQGENNVQFKSKVKEGIVFYEYINSHPSKDVHHRMSFLHPKEIAVKELYRLRKYFNHKYNISIMGSGELYVRYQNPKLVNVNSSD